MGKYENGTDTRKKILQSAEILFFEKGYSDTTVSDIAQFSHVSKASILYHFSSKDRLYTQCCMRILNKVLFSATKDLKYHGYEALLYSYLFWYRYYHDEKFRRYSCESLGRLVPPDYAPQQTYMSIQATYGISTVFEEFMAANEGVLEIANGLEDIFIRRIGNDIADENEWIDTARKESLAYARLFCIPDSLIRKKQFDLEKMLSGIDMREAVSM